MVSALCCPVMESRCHAKFTKEQAAAAVNSYISLCGCTIMPHDMLSKPEAPLIEELISRRGLSAVFQPIVGFETRAICGYEGLIPAQRARRLRCHTPCSRRRRQKAAPLTSSGPLREPVSKPSHAFGAKVSYFSISVQRRFSRLRLNTTIRLICSGSLG
jgi:hypothetical protein